MPALAPVPKAIERSGCCNKGTATCQPTATCHKDAALRGTLQRQSATLYCRNPSASLQAQREAGRCTAHLGSLTIAADMQRVCDAEQQVSACLVAAQELRQAQARHAGGIEVA